MMSMIPWMKMTKVHKFIVSCIIILSGSYHLEVAIRRVGSGQFTCCVFSDL
jgi:hypothetical protein